MSIRVKSRVSYFFLLPFLIAFAVFYAFPIIYSIVLSFFRWSHSGPQKFVGFHNYISLLTKDPFFVNSIKTTLILLVSGGIVPNLIAFPMAIILNQKFIRGKEILKAAFFIPYITSTMALCILFRYICQKHIDISDFFIVNMLGKVGLDVPRASLTILLNWRFIGWNLLLYYTGLKAIPKEYYEAAEVAGASSLKKHIHITLPLLIPTIFFAFCLTIIYCLQLFDEAFILNFGYRGIGNSKWLTPAYYLMFRAFGGAARFGKASAAAWLLLIIIFVLISSIRVVTKRLQK